MTNSQDREEEKAASVYAYEAQDNDKYIFTGQGNPLDIYQSAYDAFLAGVEWERKRLLGVIEQIQNANKPFTMAGIIERESILHTFRQELGAFDEKKAQPTEGGE